MEQCIMVVKVGSSTLTRRTKAGSWQLDQAAFQRLAVQIQQLQQEGNDVVIVSSGAITAGMAAENLSERPSKTTDMPQLQALASIGNPHLVFAWQKALGRQVGSVLLTRHNLDENEVERNQAVRVVAALLARGAVPVVNENDAVADEEIAYGDNDTLAATLAARLAQAGHVVKLVLLSDVDGVYADVHDPQTRIATITNIDAHQHVAGPAGTATGTGGMVTKLAAAQVATAAGVDMWIANGSVDGAIIAALAGETGTHFTTDTSFTGAKLVNEL